MNYLLLICADEDVEAASPERPLRLAGLERADLDDLDEPADAPQGAVRFGSVDVRPVWWRGAA